MTLDRRTPLRTAFRPAATERLLALAVLLTAITGCRLPCYEGPSAKNVLASRELTQRGLREAEQGQWSDADKLFSKAVQQCPADAEARRLYAESLWRRGQSADALFQMSEAVRLAEGEAQPLLRYAEMRFERGEFAAAFNGAQQALDQNPHSAEAWSLRARLWQSQGDLSQAAADYHQALRYENSRRDALAGLAEIHRLRGEPQRALANLQALADTYAPGQAPREVVEQEAQALLALNRPADAATRFTAACRCGSPSHPLWIATADCQIRAGNVSAARTTLEQAAFLWPGSTDVARLRSQIALDGPPRLTSLP